LDSTGSGEGQYLAVVNMVINLRFPPDMGISGLTDEPLDK